MARKTTRPTDAADVAAELGERLTRDQYKGVEIRDWLLILVTDDPVEANNPYRCGYRFETSNPLTASRHAGDAAVAIHALSYGEKLEGEESGLEGLE